MIPETVKRLSHALLRIIHDSSAKRCRCVHIDLRGLAILVQIFASRVSVVRIVEHCTSTSLWALLPHLRVYFRVLALMK